MADLQRTRSDVPPPRHATEYGAREGQWVEANELPTVKRLDGEVVRIGKHPFVGRTHCDVWAGWWKKCGRVEGGREETYDEKVGLNPTTSILLTRLLAGRPESASSVKVIKEGVQGLTLADRLDAVPTSRLLPRSLGTRT